jgi:hypothetical protein
MLTRVGAIFIMSIDLESGYENRIRQSPIRKRKTPDEPFNGLISPVGIKEIPIFILSLVVLSKVDMTLTARLAYSMFMV